MTLAGETVAIDAYCYHCGADWSDWPTLTDEQREEVSAANPDAMPGAVYDGRCPSCGFDYRDEDEDAPYEVDP